MGVVAWVKKTMSSLAWRTLSRAVRRELSLAQTAGQGQLVQFRTGPVELEFDVAVTRTRSGEGGVQIWVLTLGGKLEREHATTQRIKVTLHPVKPFGNG